MVNLLAKNMIHFKLENAVTIINIVQIRERYITLNSNLQLSVLPPPPHWWRTVCNWTEEERMSKYWRTREAFYQARGEVGAPLISVRSKLVKTRLQVIKEQQLVELQVIKEWQQALKQQYMAQQLVEPQLCKDYYKAEREELRKRQEEPYISIKVLRKIPVQLWLFRSMLFAEALKEIREEINGKETKKK